MKDFLKKASSFVICICMCIVLFTPITNNALYSSDRTRSQAERLSTCRKIYISEDNKGYPSAENTELVFWNPMTEIDIVSDDFSISTISGRDNPVIQLNSADQFEIQISFADKQTDSKLYSSQFEDKEENTITTETYTLVHDSWGGVKKGKKEQTISANGQEVATGEIASGALVIQTSSDGISWEQIDYGKYASGLYTTDVLDIYHGTTQTYQPNGVDIKKGVYISVNFFYEVKYESKTQKQNWFGDLIGKLFPPKTEYLNICESYMFFVIEDNVEVITFNNLTTATTTEIISVAKPYSENSEEFQKQSEQHQNYVNAITEQILPTMYDGDMSVTGFRINVTANPYLDISVKRNNECFTLPERQEKNGQSFYEISEYGRYDITISSYSQKKELTLYIDNRSADEAYQSYFGNSITHNGETYGNEFLDYSPFNAYNNQRVFDKYSNIPVFIGPLTLKTPKPRDNFSLPIYGYIKNESTGKSYPLGKNTTTLNEYGEYKIEFFTNADYYNAVILGNSDTKMAGDVRRYTFRFKLIGKTSGHSVNEELLEDKSFGNLSILSPSDYIPKFYGVARTSANKGRIIIAFADKESALQYATNVARSEIEDQEDGQSWKIPNVENPWGAKIHSYSGWDNAKMVTLVAEKMVEEHYFDLTTTSSYLTLEKNALDFDEENGIKLTNLQLADITKSIVIWFSTEQREKATVSSVQIDGHTIIKFIGKQSIAVLSANENGVYSIVNEKERDYHFIKDMLELDSCSLQATDRHGKTYVLNYEEGLYAQLQKLNCNSGIFTITESNIYGTTTATYDIYYIKGGDQPSVLTLTADDKKITVTQKNIPTTVVCEKIRIDKLSEHIDPYTYVRVRTDKAIQYYTATDIIGQEFTNSGNYEFAVIDRFGNHFTYHITIK